MWHPLAVLLLKGGSAFTTDTCSRQQSLANTPSSTVATTQSTRALSRSGAMQVEPKVEGVLLVLRRPRMPGCFPLQFCCWYVHLPSKPRCSQYLFVKAFLGGDNTTLPDSHWLAYIALQPKVPGPLDLLYHTSPAFTCTVSQPNSPQPVALPMRI